MAEAASDSLALAGSEAGLRDAVLRRVMLAGLGKLSTPGLLTLVTLGQWAADVFVQPSLDERGTIPWASMDELLAGAGGDVGELEDGDAEAGDDEDGSEGGDADEGDAVPPLALTPWDLEELAALTERCAILIEHLGD